MSRSTRALAWRGKVLRYGLRGVVALALLVMVAAGGLLLNGKRKIERVVEVDVAAVPYVSGGQALALGKYLYESRCGECHGLDGSGKVFLDEPENGLLLRGANLTMGSGSAVSHYRPVDWVRTIRHGVKPDGRPVFVMPSEDFNRLTDVDLASMVAYIRSLPAIDAPPASMRLPLVAQLAYGAGVMKDAAEKIDHRLPPSQPVPVAISIEHGGYVAEGCKGCHRADYTGGPIAGAPPDWPAAARLRGNDSAIARYQSADQFKSLIRTGVRPDGSTVDHAMPRNIHLNDVDLEAMYVFFQSLRGDSR
jgi:mono/diheme cytochrome c family protein